MLPGNVASSISIGGLFLSPDNRATSPLVDWELGGFALNDASMGLMVQPWKLTYVDASDVTVEPEGGDPIVLFSHVGISDLALAFDQNMRAVVAFKIGDNLFLRWYDSTVSAYVEEDYGVGKNPKLSLDDKRATQAGSSDVIFAFIQDGDLCYRQQRDRYAVKRVLKSGLESSITLTRIGMNNALRMQFELA